ncbi:MAG: hypothetical protein KAR62_08290, partial [Sphingomonadales bacterium]|nr:hypothetical protein [Sphingomonadales bacterium]
MRIKSIALLLSSVSAMALMNSEPAEAYCSWHSGTKTYTCTGEMPNGERHTRHYTFDMNFSNLSHNISPRSGTHVAELGSWGPNGGNGVEGHWSWDLSNFGWQPSTNGHNGHSLSGRSTLRYNGNAKTVTGTNASAIALYGTGGNGGNGVYGVSFLYLGDLFYSHGTSGGHGGNGPHLLASVN